MTKLQAAIEKYRTAKAWVDKCAAAERAAMDDVQGARHRARKTEVVSCAAILAMQEARKELLATVEEHGS